MSVVTYENVETPVFEIDFIRYLFTDGAQGTFWGPLPYYSDAAGTVEADWGDPVGNIPDASGNEQDWTQVTSTARPILGRVPVGGRRNIATRTEEVISSSRGWADANFIDSIGIHGKRYLRFLSPSIGTVLTGFSAAPVEDGEYVISWFWMPGSPTSQINIVRSGAPIVNPVNGFIRGDGTKHLSNGDDLVDVEMLPTGELRISIKTLVQGGSGGQNYRWNISTPTAGEVVLLTGGMIVVGDTNYPYQRVGNEYDITEAGVKGIHYLRFDGTDDQVTTTLPAISGGTIVLAGTNGIWIDSLDFAGGEFSVGPDTYTGGPTGLMPTLGDILVGGGFVIDRALTPEEIDRVKSYYKARGSAGLFQWGDEIVGDPEFDNPGYWSTVGNISITGGQCVFDEVTIAEDYCFRANVLSYPGYFRAVWNVSSLSGGSLRSTVGQGTGGSAQGTSEVGSLVHYAYLPEPANLNRLRISRNPGETPVNATIDSVSLRKLELIP